MLGHRREKALRARVWAGVEQQGTADALAAAEELRPFLWRGRQGDTVAFRNAAPVAVLHWTRMWSQDRPTGEELALAFTLFEHLYAVDPELVPAMLAFVFDEDVPVPDADGDVARHWAECAMLLFEHVTEHEDLVATRDHAVRLARGAGDQVVDMDAGDRITVGSALITSHFHVPADDVPPTAVAHARQALAEAPISYPDRPLIVSVLGKALTEVARTDATDEPLIEALRLLRNALAPLRAGHPWADDLAISLFLALGFFLERHHDSPAAASAAGELRRLLPLVPETTPGRADMAVSALAMEVGHLVKAGEFGRAEELRPELEHLMDTQTPGTSNHDLLLLQWVNMATTPHIARARPIPDAELAGCVAAVRAAATEDSDFRPELLAYLVSQLVAQSQLTGDGRVLDEAVDLLTDALSTTDAGTEDHGALSARLAWVLVHRFTARGDPADLDSAVPVLREQLSAAPPGTSDWFEARFDLGAALGEQAVLTGDENTYFEAMSLLRPLVAAPERSSRSRLVDAQVAGMVAARLRRWDDAADVLAAGVALMPELVRPGLRRVDQEGNLVLWAGLVNEAVAAAGHAGDPRRAVTLMDQGRTVLMHQALDVRGDTARIRAVHPSLAAGLDRVRAELDVVTDPAQRRMLEERQHAVLTEIRTRPGFERFFRRADYSVLRPADDQTVVIVNAADHGCAAFLATAADVRTVPLPELSTADLRERVTEFLAALTVRTTTTDRAEARAAIATVTSTLDWLWHTVAAPVLDALGHTAAPGDDPWPRVHWYPTWLLGFLPIHAATARSGAAVLDRVVSSYALSLRTLRFASRRPAPPEEHRSLLVVSTPDAPGLPPLPQAGAEADGLRALVRNTELLTGERAAYDEVSEAMRRHAWVHFACHATQDLNHPSEGALYLHDHQSRHFTVEHISRMRLAHAQFAFLSACDTARGGIDLPNEALHLGGALCLAGYQHVIATLWPIHDTIAATATRQVYEHLHTDGTLDPTRAAHGLHDAVHALRRLHPDDPTLWAGLIHIGP